MAKLGFIGLGIMGKPMAGHLVAAGHEVFLNSRSGVPPELEGKGKGKPCASAKEVAQNADVTFLMLPDTPDVEKVLFGAGGVAEGLAKGKTVVDMSSIAPLATKEYAKRVNELGCDYLDAPVSGGEVGAKGASLTIMVGGPEAAFNRVKPFFELMGKNITLVGGNGDGQTCKVANQIIVALTIEAVGEALLFASKAGADPAKVRQALMGGLRRLAHPRGPRRAHDQAQLPARLPDRAAPEGPQPRARGGAVARALAAEYGVGAAALQRLRRERRGGVGPLRPGQGARADGQARGRERLT